MREVPSVSRDSERALYGIIDFIPDALFVTDTESTLLDVNAAFEALFHKHRQEFAGIRFNDLLRSVRYDAQIAARLEQYAGEVVHTGKPVSFDAEADGQWNRYVINPIFASEGRVVRLFFVIQNITAL
jgi:PAS domain S-box-containing protein